VWDIDVVIRHSNRYAAAAATWYAKTFPDYDIGEAVGVRLAIQFALDMGFIQATLLMWSKVFTTFQIINLTLV